MNDDYECPNPSERMSKFKHAHTIVTDNLYEALETKKSIIYSEIHENQSKRVANDKATTDANIYIELGRCLSNAYGTVDRLG